MKKKLKLFTDSDLLIHEYLEQGAVDIKIIPIPHIPKLSGHTPREPFIISYLGSACQNKGFQYLPYLLKRTKFAASVLPEVRFKITGWVDNPDAGFYSWNIESLQEDLRVDLYLDPLTEADRNAILSETDVGLVLYNKTTYAKQTSSVVSELVAAGAIIVAFRGTWAARQVARYSLGALAMPDDVINAGDALLDVLTNFAFWKKRLQAGRDDFLRFHNPENFAEIAFGTNK
jgi:glycosyltransferase involved in cell wall biosynthesis